MENKMKKLTGVISIVIMMMGCSLNAKTTNSGTIQPYHWYDGGEKRIIYLDENMIADFNATSETAAKAATSSGMTPVRTIGNVRLWTMSSFSAKAALNTIKANDSTGSYSSVFRSSEKGGPLSALPGRVIVQFPSDWDEGRIKQWVSDQGETINGKASFGTNFYILDTPPGLVSLETANRLYETGDVLLASPNWWKESFLK
jgi:hypothetical protein